MFTLDIYTLVTLLSAAAFAVMGVGMALKRIPQEELFYKLRLARNFMIISLLMMALSAVGETLSEPVYHPQLSTLYTLTSGAFQCTCLVTILLCLLNPAIVSYRRSGMWLGATLAWSTICGILYWFFPSQYIIYLFYALYLFQITISLTLFLRHYRSCLEVLKVTDTKHLLELHWIQWAFYLAVSINFLILIVVWLPEEVHSVFNVLTVCYFVWFTSRFSTFAGQMFRDYMPIMTEAGLTDLPPESVDEYVEREAICHEKVDAWIAQHGYCAQDDRDAAATKMGLSSDDLQWYCTVVLKQDFRAWRIGLRIEEAKNILASNPDVPINEMAYALGFTTRSNFYLYFKKITGESTTEYIRRMHLIMDS